MGATYGSNYIREGFIGPIIASNGQKSGTAIMGNCNSSGIITWCRQFFSSH